MTSYHGYMQPVGEYRYWGSCEFWKNCYKVINGELTDTEIVYNCGRYDQCITKFDKETGYLAAPKKNDLMYDNARGSYMVYTEKKWKNVEVDDSQFSRIEAIILSMTPQERANPDLINPSRKKRIADGAGVPISEVNKLIKQFEQSRKMMKQMSGMMGGKRRGGFKLPFGF